MVRSVSFRFDVSMMIYEGGDNDYPGGLGVEFTYAKDHAFFSDNMRLVSGVDPATENTGLLRGIIEFLQTIVNGIKSIGQAIVELPGKIVNGIIEGLKSLFIPSEDDITEIKTNYETLLSERLGFVWQVGEWIVNFGQSVISAITSNEDYIFIFPGVTVNLPEGEFTIIPETPVSLDNAAMDVIRPVLGTIVSLVCVIAFVNTAERMLAAIVSGASYFEFLKGGKEDDS